MIRPVVINPSALDDIAAATAWYEEQRPGLSRTFSRRVEETLKRIGLMPELYGKVFEDLRLTLVPRFPYAVVYRVDVDQVTVVAVYHTRRDPKGWQSRSREL